MASGSFTGTGSKVRLKISWSSSKGSGGSNVNATLYAVNVDDYYFYATVSRGYSITINGSEKTGNTAKLSSSMNGTATLLSHSKWVSYTGNKSITISGEADMSNINANGYVGVRTVSGTAVLDKIGSKPTMGAVTAPITSTISEKSSTIQITWGKATSYNGSAKYILKVSINGASYSTVATITNINTTSYSYTIPNKTQGTKYRFSVYANNDVGSSSTYYSGTVTINKLSSPTIGNIDIYNPYVTPSLTIDLSGGSQLDGGTFKRMASLYYDSELISEADYNSVSDNNTSIVFTVDPSVYLQYLGINNYTGTFKIIAWNENANRSKSGNVEKTFTVNINTDGGAVPTVDEPILSGGTLNNPATCFIAGMSNLVVTSPNAVLRRAPSGATLTYKIECTGATSQNNKTATFTGLTSGTKTITITVTDSRGLSTSVSKQCVFQSWSKPVVKITSCDRVENNTTTAKLVYSISYSPIYQYTTAENKGAQLNGITSQQYNLNNGNWNDASSGSTISGLNTELTYLIAVRANDKVNTSEYGMDTLTIPTINPILSMRSNGVGIRCVPQGSFAFEVTGASRLDGDLVIGASKTTASDGKSGLFISQNGYMDISHASSPYIDFHYGNSVADYTQRILGNSSGLNLYSTNGIHLYTGSSKNHSWIDSTGNLTMKGNIIAGQSLQANDLKVLTITPNAGDLTVNGNIIADNFTDSGWVDCTVASGFALYYTDQPLQVRKIGNIVMLRGVLKNTSTVTLNITKMATLPDGFAPTDYNINYVMQGSGSYRWLLRINTDGMLYGERYSNNTTANNSMTAGQWLNCFAVWFLN